MTVEEMLKSYIIATHSSVHNFSKSIDMPYGTLTSVFTRGIRNSSMKTVIKICEGLNISLDELANNRIVSNLPSSEGVCNFNNETDMLLIMTDMYEYLKDIPVVTYDNYTVSKESIDTIFKSFKIVLETFAK